jgi:hypothetical protein
MALGGRIWKRVTFVTGLLTSTFSKWVYWGNLSDRTVVQLLRLSAWTKHPCCVNMLILNYFTISKEFLEAIFPRLDSSTRTITNEKMEWSQYLSSQSDPCSVSSSHSQVVWLLCCCYVSTSFCHLRHQCLLCPLCCIFLPNIGGSFLLLLDEIFLTSTTICCRRYHISHIHSSLGYCHLQCEHYQPIQGWKFWSKQFANF